MKIKDLFNLLKDEDPETELLVRGYEGGWNNLNFISKNNLILDVHPEPYYGSHDLIENLTRMQVVEFKDNKVIVGILLV
jgi:hypothetical protein